jgi:hypothetical protein
MAWEESVYLNGKLVEVLTWREMTDFWRTVREAEDTVDDPGDDQLYDNWKSSPGRASTHYVDGAGNRWKLVFRQVSNPRRAWRNSGKAPKKPKPPTLREMMDFYQKKGGDLTVLAREAGVTNTDVMEFEYGFLYPSQMAYKKLERFLRKNLCFWCGDIEGFDDGEQRGWPACLGCGGV